MTGSSPDWREFGVRIARHDQVDPSTAQTPGFIYVPPHVPHQEMNASQDEPLRCVVVRSDQEPVVVNLDISSVRDPSFVKR